MVLSKEMCTTTVCRYVQGLA